MTLQINVIINTLSLKEVLDMEERETTEIRKTSIQDGDATVERADTRQTTKAPGPVVARRVVYYIGGVIVALLVMRLVLQLLGANEGNGFVDIVYALTTVLILPFYGIFGEPSYGESQLETSTLVAIIVYSLITIGVGKLFTLTRSQA